MCRICEFPEDYECHLLELEILLVVYHTINFYHLEECWSIVRVI